MLTHTIPAKITTLFKKLGEHPDALRKLGHYSLISFLSFVASTTILHTTAHAQAPQPQINYDFQPTEIPLTVTPIPTLSLTPTPSPTDVPAITKPQPTTAPEPPTSQPTPSTSSVLSTADAEPTAQVTSAPQITGGLNADLLFSMANAHRQSLGLHELQKDEKTCSLAAARAPEIAAEMAAGTLHSGMYGRNLPYWNTENAIALGSEEAAFNWWLNEPLHRQAIESKTHTHSCTACSGKYCVQEFTSYQSK